MRPIDGYQWRIFDAHSLAVLIPRTKGLHLYLLCTKKSSVKVFSGSERNALESRFVFFHDIATNESE